MTKTELTFKKKNCERQEKVKMVRGTFLEIWPEPIVNLDLRNDLLLLLVVLYEIDVI